MAYKVKLNAKEKCPPDGEYFSFALFYGKAENVNNGQQSFTRDRIACV